jgi:hypothetical protein
MVCADTLSVKIEATMPYSGGAEEAESISLPTLAD